MKAYESNMIGKVTPGKDFSGAQNINGNTGQLAVQLYRVRNISYGMSKKSWPILYSNFLFKMGQVFLDIQSNFLNKMG